MLMLGSNEIGGGYVRIGFTDNGKRLRVGTPLTAEKIKSWPRWKTLMETGRITVYPPASHAIHHPPSERHVVSAGFGRFDVFEGRKLNDKALTKEEAEALSVRHL